MSSTKQQIDTAKEILAYYTLAASATGAVPVPAATVAITAQNAAMIAHISSTLGVGIDIVTVTSSFGALGSIAYIARNFFIDGAKALSWGTGSIWALAALSALGAATAGMQTYMVGMLAIEIGKNSGNKLSPEKADSIINEAKNSYRSFTEEWKTKSPVLPFPNNKSGRSG